MRKLGLLCSLLYIICISCSNINIIEVSKNPPPIEGTPLLWGYDDAAHIRLDFDILEQIIDEFGFDLAVHHYSEVGDLFALKKIIDFYTERDMRLILNLESANNDGSSFIDNNGFDWFNHDDGHYFMFPEEALQMLQKMSPKIGVMYDEPGHMQNRFRMNVPYFMKPEEVSCIDSASVVFTAKVKKIADKYKSYNIDVYTEHVFPIQFHTFAKAGFTAVPKMLKESCMAAYLAIALGASMQYKTPFWTTPDLWMKDIYPGHSVEQYKSALMMSYHMGADAIYTENLYYKGNNTNKDIGSLVFLKDNNQKFNITELGKVNKWFRWIYAPQNPRYYKHQDLKPKIAIIRQEDACWGQRNSWLPDRLFGVDEWKSNDITEAWLQIWNLLSNGVINTSSINWNNNEVGSTPYQVFAPLDGVVVFDERVQADCLKDVELIFLTGIGISNETLQAVKNKVKYGAICVSLPHLVPKEIIKNIDNNGELIFGNGKWIITTSFLSDNVKKGVKKFLPQKNYMRYRFGNYYVEIYPIKGNKDKIEVKIKHII